MKREQLHQGATDKMQELADWELNTRISTLQACNPEELFSVEIQQIVDETLNMLPERTRIIFTMSRYQNKSHKEIAQEFEITTKGVEFHIDKALKTLRISLKDYFSVFIYLFM
jgi:RNA polymerase sigma-70 factor (ECF subfamily)